MISRDPGPILLVKDWVYLYIVINDEDMEKIIGNNDFVQKNTHKDQVDHVSWHASQLLLEVPFSSF